MSATRRKMPTKSELMQLQKLYRTDEKIGERLGGVPAYLVAYWRRKKNVPKHSQPKFSEHEVRSLWERFGDDDRCGLELGISKAAFYNWRRRYGIREKPAFLKLEQLELNLPGMDRRNHVAPLYGKQTVAQKMLARAAGLEKAKVGELVVVEPDLVVVNRDLTRVIDTFKDIGVEFVWNPGRVAFGLDGGNQSGTDSPDELQVAREFCRRQKITQCYDLYQGTSLQLSLEKGLILPGHLVVSLDPLAVSLGALSAFAVRIDALEMATVLASGRLWLKVPPSIRIDIGGRRPRGVYAKDISLAILKQLGTTRAEYSAIEFHGQAVAGMSISERVTLCQVAKEMGAKAALCPFEAVTRRYLTGRNRGKYQPVIADKDAVYGEAYQFNTDRFTPQIAGPNGVETISPVRELEGLKVHQVIVGTFGNGRFDDLRLVANILKGNKVSPGCRLVILPGSHQVYLEALKKGLIRVLAEAGAMILSSTNAPLSDRFHQMLAPGERCLTTADPATAFAGQKDGAETYLCSPATAAASALNGKITNPEPYVK